MTQCSVVTHPAPRLFHLVVGVCGQMGCQQNTAVTWLWSVPSEACQSSDMSLCIRQPPRTRILFSRRERCIYDNWIRVIGALIHCFLFKAFPVTIVCFRWQHMTLCCQCQSTLSEHRLLLRLLYPLHRLLVTRIRFTVSSTPGQYKSLSPPRGTCQPGQ